LVTRSGIKLNKKKNEEEKNLGCKKNSRRGGARGEQVATMRSEPKVLINTWGGRAPVKKNASALDRGIRRHHTEKARRRAEENLAKPRKKVVKEPGAGRGMRRIESDAA